MRVAQYALGVGRSAYQRDADSRMRENHSRRILPRTEWYIKTDKVIIMRRPASCSDKAACQESRFSRSSSLSWVDGRKACSE